MNLLVSLASNRTNQMPETKYNIFKLYNSQ